MKTFVLAAAVAALLTGTASAQVFYNGWDLGPDYSKMLEGALQQEQMMAEQMRAYEQQIIDRALQDPICQKQYAAYTQTGGAMNPRDFAYLCAATGRFTPEGIAYFQRSEANNQRQELLKVIELRQYEAMRGQAQMDLSTGFGNGIQGQGSTLIEGGGNQFTWDSQKVNLPQLSAGQQYRDPGTGLLITRDANGFYWYLGRNGQWQQL